ncbi:MAG TPA: lauroyl acyltransferase [Sedimenticola sp.]|nr:lauroyl acyltransferase [Sedimenticola sp.]
MSFLADPPFWQRFRQAPLPQRAGWLAQALSVGLFWQLCLMLSPDRASRLGRLAMQLIGPRLQRSIKIEGNLRHAFPDWDEEQIHALARQVWGNIGAVTAEYPHLERIAERQRLETVFKEGTETILRAGRPVIFVAGHLANWEVAPLAITQLMKQPVSVVHSRQRNPLFDGMLQRRREPLQCGFVNKGAGARPLLQLLEAGNSLGFVADVRINSGQPLPFFGKDAMTTITPARLALKYGCPLLPVQVERLAGARFRVTVHPPLETGDPAADATTRAMQMMTRVNALYESWIRQHPAQWWCPKNRWPKNQKKIRMLMAQRRRASEDRSRKTGGGREGG